MLTNQYIYPDHCVLWSLVLEALLKLVNIDGHLTIVVKYFEESDKNSWHWSSLCVVSVLQRFTIITPLTLLLISALQPLHSLDTKTPNFSPAAPCYHHLDHDTMACFVTTAGISWMVSNLFLLLNEVTLLHLHPTVLGKYFDCCLYLEENDTKILKLDRSSINL